MATWPDIANPSALRERPIKGQIRSNFESGYAYSRAKWTRMRYIFELSWKVMHRDDLDTLQSFFNSNLGGTFSWTHPDTGVSYTVRFKEDEIDAEWVVPKGYRVSVELEEQ